MATTLPLQGETHARPTTLPPRQAALLSASRVEQKGNIIVKWITSTDHKTIGYMYLIASVLFFLLGGVMALIIRAELCGEYHSMMLFNVQVVSESEYETYLASLRDLGQTGDISDAYVRLQNLPGTGGSSESEGGH